MTSWLTLQEYSIQKGISVSTLRRKIKNRELLDYKFSNGRYLLRSHEASPFEQELKQKTTELESLKRDYEDLLSLVNFLETEKKDLLKYIEQKIPPSL